MRHCCYKCTLFAIILIVTLAILRSYAAPEIDHGIALLSPNDAQKFWKNFTKNCFSEEFACEFELRNFVKNQQPKVFIGKICYAPQAKNEFFATIATDGEDIQLNFSNKKYTSALLQPIAPGTLLTPADVCMPFLHISNVKYAGSKRVLGRPAQIFHVHLPQDAIPGTEYLRVAIDQNGEVVLLIENMNNNKILRQLKVNGFRKFGKSWSIESIDVLDIKSREKSRIIFHEYYLSR